MDISKHLHSLDEYLTYVEAEFFEKLTLDDLNNTFLNISNSSTFNDLDNDDILLLQVDMDSSEVVYRKIIEVKTIKNLRLTLYDITATLSNKYAQHALGYINIFNITPLLDETTYAINVNDIENTYKELKNKNKNKQLNTTSTDAIVNIDNLEQDNVNHPSHYNYGDIEVIDYIKQVANGYKNHPYEAYCIGNVLKYISRSSFKNGREDLEKAQWYLNAALETYEDE